MTTPTMVTPGWYADPTGRHEYRYWAGQGWTDAVADGGRTTIDPPTMPAPAVAVTAPAPTAEAPVATPSEAASWPAPDTAPVPGPAPDTASVAPPIAAGRRARRWWILPVAIIGVLILVAGVAGWVILTLPGPRPEALSAYSITSTSAALTWSRPKEGAAPQRYVIRRNGVIVGRVAAVTTYQDSGLNPLKDYRYKVQAMVDGRTSHPTPDLVVRTPPASPLAPTTREVTRTSVVVTWSPPEGVTPDRYIVRRDGGDLATVSASTRTYRDTSLRPLAEVSYTIVALTQGRRSDPTPALQVTTLPPPIGEARLQGSWDATLKVTRAGQTRLKVGEGGQDTWSFTPRCASGPCGADLTASFGAKPFKIALTRTGAVYKGSTKAHVARCMNIDVVNTISVTVRVTGGAPNEGDWSVSTWSGSLELSIPYTRAGNYYCPTQSATFSVTPEAAAPPTTT